MRLMDIFNQLLEDDEKAASKTPPAEDADLKDQQPDAKEVEDENEDEGAAPSQEDDDDEDVGSVAKRQGFEKSKKSMYAFGKTRPVTLLTKTEKVGGLDVTFQYAINPKTGAWSLRACLAGQDDEDMVEHSTGEDPTSLIESLKKSKKITPHWLADNLEPSTGKSVSDNDADSKPEEKEVTEAELSEKCWTGYAQKGYKKKGRRTVPNCVPVK
jgi:hypothetical protein